MSRTTTPSSKVPLPRAIPTRPCPICAATSTPPSITRRPQQQNDQAGIPAEHPVQDCRQANARKTAGADAAQAQAGRQRRSRKTGDLSRRRLARPRARKGSAKARPSAPQTRSRSPHRLATAPVLALFQFKQVPLGYSRQRRGRKQPLARSAETELGRYKSKIYRAIGSRWYLNVDIAKTDLSIGTVRIKFFIQSNGVVSNVEVLEDSGSQMLHTISLKSILDSAPFEPFSESLKQQLGNGYDEEFTFSIY